MFKRIREFFGAKPKAVEIKQEYPRAVDTLPDPDVIVHEQKPRQMKSRQRKGK